MENRSQPKRPDIDFRTGFEIVWQKKRGVLDTHIYTLMKVPIEIPSKITYTKSTSGIGISLTPISLFQWKVSGIIGTDTMENLNLEISRPRQRNNPPIVTQEDVKKISKFGMVIDLSNNRTRFNINITIPMDNIVHFLNKVWWEPLDKAKWDPKYHTPRFFLGGLKGFRTLPQKTILNQQMRSGASLIVEKILNSKD